MDAPADAPASAHWTQAMQYFVSEALPEVQGYLSGTRRNVTNQYIYFEIGNEQNIHDDAFYGPLYPDGANALTNHYPSLFAAGAQGLDAVLQGKVKGYRILPSGPIEPTAAIAPLCLDSRTTKTNLPGLYNYRIAAQALAQANRAGVAYVHLGVAIHPYN